MAKTVAAHIYMGLIGSVMRMKVARTKHTTLTCDDGAILTKVQYTDPAWQLPALKRNKEMIAPIILHKDCPVTES
jgi:hypothetical protein